MIRELLALTAGTSCTFRSFFFLCYLTMAYSDLNMLKENYVYVINIVVETDGFLLYHCFDKH
jgi:hypothetical protein